MRKEKSEPKIFSQMVVNDGDESHGIPIRKKPPEKQIQSHPLSPPKTQGKS